MDFVCIDLFDSPCAGMGLHVREGVKQHNTHIEPNSFKIDPLGKLIVKIF